jgi:hypothetical protein
MNLLEDGSQMKGKHSKGIKRMMYNFAIVEGKNVIAIDSTTLQTLQI